MENKVRLKKHIIICSICCILYLLVMIGINHYEYKKYTENFNEKIDSIVGEICREYEGVEEQSLIKILNSSSSSDINLDKYGIDLETESIILNNDIVHTKYMIINILGVVGFIIICGVMFYIYEKKKNKEIEEITRCIEKINRKNYELDIDGISEDELSILKNEIYKTTILLKEQAENANKDKINLKNSLSDISHQLKTPLTSILIMLDNIIDDPDMEKDIREEFVRSIKRDISNINFLVQVLLKLSKLETNTVNFITKEVDIHKILDETMQNVSSLCDLKDVEVEIKGDTKNKIKCDVRWQVEAVTNIVKNAIEHSSIGGKVLIKCEDNNVFSQIKVTNYGEVIDKEDKENIFKRFYRGKNASKDSVGIGLALAKSIIENDNGRISVESEEGVGTSFVIKYFKV